MSAAKNSPGAADATRAAELLDEVEALLTRPASDAEEAVSRWPATAIHLIRDLAAVARAADALYRAARWEASAIPAGEQAALWIRLRDALRLTPGAATALGFGSSAVAKRGGKSPSPINSGEAEE